MRKSIAIGAGVLVGAAATAVGAAGSLTLPNPMFGSDTLFVVTKTAIDNDSADFPANTSAVYVAGGSGVGQSAMLGSGAGTPKQNIAPMSKMLTNGVCAGFGGTAGSAMTNAGGIAVGMDAIDIYASNASAESGTTACNNVTTPGTANATGLAASGTTGIFAGGNPPAAQNWKFVLALLYGGRDLTVAAAAPTSVAGSGNPACDGTARKSLVNNWSKLFQNGCSNATGICSDAAHTVGGATPIWHAYRRDDGSGTSDVFSSLIGITDVMPSTSNTSNNGFGASPYCNAINWDTSPINNGGGFCNLGGDDQFVGPGGVPDPQSACTFTDFGHLSTADVTCGAAGSGNHRRPPPGTWGDAPIKAGFASDVLPTSFQDNDPIRRPCLGTMVKSNGLGSSPFHPAEEVCNLDNALGVVLPIPSADFIVDLGKQQYPTKVCNSFLVGKAPQVLSCAPFGGSTTHDGQCPNGDKEVRGGCEVPVDTTNNSSQCLDVSATVVTHFSHSYPAAVHNLFMPDGDMNDGAILFIQDKLQNGSAAGLSVDFTGGFGRIHSIATIYDASLANPPNTGCQLSDATDNISCLAQADPCSVGYAGDGGKSWAARSNGNVCANLTANGVSPLPPGCAATDKPSDSMRIAGIYPTSQAVLNLGQQATGNVEYEISRKLYLNSILGFGHMDTGVDTNTAGELALAKFEAIGTNMTPILNSVGYFPFSANSQLGTVTGSSVPVANFSNPFCEDFNEKTICASTAANHSSCLGASGDNAVTTGAPTGSICGDGVLDPYEECDNSTDNGTSGNKCSTTCRCTGTNSYLACSATTPCNGTGANGTEGKTTGFGCR